MSKGAKGEEEEQRQMDDDVGLRQADGDCCWDEADNIALLMRCKHKHTHAGTHTQPSLVRLQSIVQTS